MQAWPRLHTPWLWPVLLVVVVLLLVLVVLVVVVVVVLVVVVDLLALLVLALLVVVILVVVMVASFVVLVVQSRLVLLQTDPWVYLCFYCTMDWRTSQDPCTFSVGIKSTMMLFWWCLLKWQEASSSHLRPWPSCWTNPSTLYNFSTLVLACLA